MSEGDLDLKAVIEKKFDEATEEELQEYVAQVAAEQAEDFGEADYYVVAPTLGGGDILHITLGVIDLGDGMGPWIPGPSELEAAEERWRKIVPEGVRVIATPIGEELSIIQCDRPENDEEEAA